MDFTSRKWLAFEQQKESGCESVFSIVIRVARRLDEFPCSVALEESPVLREFRKMQLLGGTDKFRF
jgi:hypothetical protein